MAQVKHIHHIGVSRDEVSKEVTEAAARLARDMVPFMEALEQRLGGGFIPTLLLRPNCECGECPPLILSPEDEVAQFEKHIGALQMAQQEMLQ